MTYYTKCLRDTNVLNLHKYGKLSFETTFHYFGTNLRSQLYYVTPRT